MVKKSRKQKGGEYNEGGTDGSPVTLAEDIYGIITYTFQTMDDAMNVIQTITDLPGDMGTAFDEKGAPNPDEVKVT